MENQKVDCYARPLGDYVQILEPSEEAREDKNNLINQLVGMVVRVHLLGDKIYTKFKNKAVELPPYILLNKTMEEYQDYNQKLKEELKEQEKELANKPEKLAKTTSKETKEFKLKTNKTKLKKKLKKKIKPK